MSGIVSIRDLIEARRAETGERGVYVQLLREQVAQAQTLHEDLRHWTERYQALAAAGDEQKIRLQVEPRLRLLAHQFAMSSRTLARVVR